MFGLDESCELPNGAEGGQYDAEQANEWIERYRSDLPGESHLLLGYQGADSQPQKTDHQWRAFPWR